ncbi:MAG: hypothetical protein QXH30_01805, partial [Candidatus Bilamarchaeaceae archaeon]
MSNNPGHKPKPLAKCPPLLPISKKMAALSPLLDAERVGTQLAANGSKSPTLEQLFETLPIVSHLHSDYGGSAKALWLFSSAWSRYFRNASFSESEDALPALNRFVDSLFQFASRANAGLSIVALECAELLLRHNIPVISSSFAKVLAFEGRDEVRQTALEIMERNLAFMLQPSCIEAIGELLKEYEDGPASFNPTIARSASAFLFAWKDQLFEDGRTHMIAYPIAWADQLPLEGRILLMIDARRQLKKGEAADILVRTAEMAANPLIQHAA